MITRLMADCGQTLNPALLHKRTGFAVEIRGAGKFVAVNRLAEDDATASAHGVFEVVMAFGDAPDAGPFEEVADVSPFVEGEEFTFIRRVGFRQQHAEPWVDGQFF